MPNDRKEKPVCYFVEDDFKPLVINKTNGRKLAELFGDDPDDWEGEQIELFLVDTQDREGQACKGIRIRAPKKRRAGNHSADEESREDDYDEEEDDDDEV